MCEECQGQAGDSENYNCPKGYRLGAHDGRGVLVPDGMEASWIIEGGRVLEDKFDIPPYESRDMVRDVLRAILPLIQKPDNDDPRRGKGAGASK